MGWLQDKVRSPDATSVSQPFPIQCQLTCKCLHTPLLVNRLNREKKTKTGTCTSIRIL